MTTALTRTDRWYTITGEADDHDGRFPFRPNQAHAYTGASGEDPTVIVRGPVVKKDRSLSNRLTSRTYGTYGTSLAAAPAYIQKIATEITRLDGLNLR